MPIRKRNQQTFLSNGSKIRQEAGGGVAGGDDDGGWMAGKQ